MSRCYEIASMRPLARSREKASCTFTNGRFFRKVTSSVRDATGNQQEPIVYGGIPDEDFYFKPTK